MSRPQVFFYVQHLLGIGHTVRAAALTRAMLAAGLDVTYVSGGFDALDEPLTGARVIRLPPARSKDARFTTVVGESGEAIDDRWRDRRRAALLEAFQNARPDLVVVETFPFGRWPFRFELLPLLDAAKGRARVVCSLRDVLVPKRKASRLTAIVELVRRHFDQVLVHGDPDFIPLDQTFARTPEIADRLRYTGYVAPAVPDPAADVESGDVLVSAGGGGTGGALMRAAHAARPYSALRDRRWRFLVGPNLPSCDRETLTPAPGVTIEPVRPDFRDLLSRSAVSVSQAGYNTVMDMLVTRARSVMVPFGAHGQSEQPFRARLLADRGWVQLVEERVLTPVGLAAAIDRAAATARPPPNGIRLDGARRSAALLSALLGSA